MTTDELLAILKAEGWTLYGLDQHWRHRDFRCCIFHEGSRRMVLGKPGDVHSPWENNEVYKTMMGETARDALYAAMMEAGLIEEKSAVAEIPPLDLASLLR